MDSIIENQVNVNLEKEVAACRHLGASSDPTVCFGFASPNNYCYRASPPEAIQTSYQESVCLTAGCVECPLYQSDWKGRLPEEISANPRGFLHGALYWVAIALAISAIALGLWYAYTLGFPKSFLLGAEAHSAPGLAAPVQESLTVPGTGISNAGQDRLTSLPLIAQSGNPTSTPTPSALDQPAALVAPFQPAVDTPLPSPTALPASPTSPPVNEAATCQPPAGWMRYNAQPGDSLSLLSRLSGASVAEIRAANCLKNSTIFIGQQLYLPHFNTSPVYNPPSSVSGPPSSSPQSSTSPDRSDPAPISPPDR